MRWPFVWYSTFRAVQLENYTLRDALRGANEELRKYRILVSRWKEETDKATLDKLKQKYNF